MTRRPRSDLGNPGCARCPWTDPATLYRPGDPDSTLQPLDVLASRRQLYELCAGPSFSCFRFQLPPFEASGQDDRNIGARSSKSGPLSKGTRTCCPTNISRCQERYPASSPASPQWTAISARSDDQQEHAETMTTTAPDLPRSRSQSPLLITLDMHPSHMNGRTMEGRCNSPKGGKTTSLKVSILAAILALA
jgi:hypothetical protein